MIFINCVTRPAAAKPSGSSYNQWYDGEKVGARPRGIENPDARNIRF